MKKLKFSTEKRKIKDLIPFEYNPRKLSQKDYDLLKKSLEKFDLAEIPVINLDNKICAGHQRISLLLEVGRGDEYIDVRVPNRMMTEEEFKEYNIKSNKISGDWDFDILSNYFEIENLKDWGFEDFELGIVDEKEKIDVDNYNEKLENYLDNNIRQITLHYSNDEYEKVILACDRILEKENMSDYSEMFYFLIKKYENN